MNEEAPATGRRRAKLVTALALAGATVIATGVTAATVATADRTPPAPVWASADTPQPPAKRPEGLAALLVPYEADYGYRPGPDDVELGGHDTVLSGDEIRKRFRAENPTWSDDERRDLERGLANTDVEATAVRSYAREYGGQGNVVRISLSRLPSKNTGPVARIMADSLAKKPGAVPGPTPEGHREARCYRFPSIQPKESSETSDRVDSLECVAHVGDVLMLAFVHSAGPLDQYRLALIGGQLDRLTQQGQPA
ncbi:hypothetical protein ACFV0R_11880 [Streptomyces sp. NPDC059578]|uniref:hypothetical protein n=1 Tax=unclassified Streptomyces TaxID=2593676 RepID=UPI003647ACF8